MQARAIHRPLPLSGGGIKGGGHCSAALAAAREFPERAQRADSGPSLRRARKRAVLPLIGGDLRRVQVTQADMDAFRTGQPWTDPGLANVVGVH